MKFTAALAALAFALSSGIAVAQSTDDRYTVLRVAPSNTDSRIASDEPEHVVIYDRSAKAGNVLLFMPGTGGTPQLTRFLFDAVDHGIESSTFPTSTRRRSRKSVPAKRCAAIRTARNSFGNAAFTATAARRFRISRRTQS